MPQSDPRDEQWIPVCSSASRREASDQALVLESLGIPHQQLHRRGEWWLLVHQTDLARAREQLELFRSESEEWPPVETPGPRLSRGIGSGLAFSVTIGLFYLFQKGLGPDRRWADLGINDSTLLLDGEWWRALTALCLHADVVHLLANMVFGTLFVASVCQVVGWGGGLLGVLLSGFAGNLLNAWIRGPGHLSLGASTALFGAIGLLAAYLFRHRRLERGRRWRRLVPLGVGLALLGFLGTSGERTDVLAHFTGFLAGLGLGGLLEWGPGRRLLGRRFSQPAAAFCALLLLLLAWAAALS